MQEGIASIRRRPDGCGAHDATPFLDIETVPDVNLFPAEWPVPRLPRPPRHRVVTISSVVAELAWLPDGRETYVVSAHRSGEKTISEEGGIPATFRRLFGALRYQLVAWNERAFDVPTILARSLTHGFDATAWFRHGDRRNGYRHRYAAAWHIDLMGVMPDHDAARCPTLVKGRRDDRPAGQARRACLAAHGDVLPMDAPGWAHGRPLP